MKGCALSCLTGLLGFLVAIAAFALAFQRLGVRGDEIAPAAIGLGFLLTLSISLLWSARGVARDRKLLMDALAGVPPVDGKWAAFSGVIRSSRPLVAPISGKSAVAYKYDVYEFVGSGKSRHKVPHYQGTALAASTISTNLGTYRLLAVPEFAMPTTEVEPETARRNFAAYRASTTFEPLAAGKSGTDRLGAEWSDDDGVYRSDRGSEEAEGRDQSEFRFDEQLIAQGESLCLIGLYSQARGGIVPDANWAYQTRVVQGSGEEAAAVLGRRARRYVIAGLLFGAVCAAITWVIAGRP